MDINKPVENPDLVRALAAIREAETPENETVLIEELRKAHFLSPVTIEGEIRPGEPGKCVIPKGATITCDLISTTDGSVYYPVFTDWEQLRLWNDKPDQQTLVTTLDTFCDMLWDNDNAGMLINPTTHSVQLTRDRLSVITGRPLTLPVHEGTRFQVGPPAEWPTGLTNALTAYFRKRREVNAAWLSLMLKGERDWSFLVTVDADAAAFPSLYQGIAATASPQMETYKLPLDILSLDSDPGQAAAATDKPFYSRSQGLMGRIRSLFT